MLLFEMFSGQRPFAARKIDEQIQIPGYSVPPLLSRCVSGVPTELSDLVARMLAKVPAERPAMRLVADRLAALAKSAPEVKP
jgi:serine/threonine protein kinase